MTNRLATLLAVAPLILLAACDPGSEQPSGGNDMASVPIETRSGDNGAADAQRSDDGPTSMPNGPMEGTFPGTLIPRSFHGRWGMVAADCGPDKAAAKGLLTIGSEILRFYESVGEPVTLEQTGPGRIEGSFAFSGEGMEWTKQMTLTLGSDGDTLVRTESDPDGSFTYTRCSG